MGTSSKAIRLKLEEIAGPQEGFFTAKQAVEAGYNDSVHPYHLRNGDWIRMYRGLYRLASHPLPSWPELIVYALWSRDRGVKSQGVYAGQTSLMIHGLMNRKPGRLEMVVPMNFRKNCEIPEMLTLSKRNLQPEDIEEKVGYRVLTVEKTISDLKNSTNPEIRNTLAAIQRTISPHENRRPSFDDMLNMGID